MIDLSVFILRSMSNNKQTSESVDREKVIRKYQDVLCKIYKSQVLGHVCLESFEEYNRLTTKEKLLIQNELRLFYLKQEKYIEALKLIERRYSKHEVISATQISDRCYYKLLNNPIVQKYVYHNEIPVKLFNAKQTSITNYDSLEDNFHITNAEELVENLYYYEKNS